MLSPRSTLSIIVLGALTTSLAFTVVPSTTQQGASCLENPKNFFSIHGWGVQGQQVRLSTSLKAEEGEGEPAPYDKDLGLEFESEDSKKEAVGNLVADDEWMGLSMELSEVVRMAVIEDLKKNAREFLGKDEYKVGDISKEIDTRVKKEVAQLRGKDDYELGDFVCVMDEFSKNMTEELTGRPYQAGDLSLEIDKRVKESVAGFCGKDEVRYCLFTGVLCI